MLFINDLPLCLIHSNLDIYADDVTLSCAFKREKSDQIVTSLTNDLENIVHWSHSNKMAINEEKTKAMLVIGKRQWKHYDIDHNLEIPLDGISIEQVKHHKLLGVQLDENLTFEYHIEDLCKKLSKRIGLLRHISPYLKRSQREFYYNAVIKPTMLYGAPIWSYGNTELEKRVLNLQKSAARIILGAERSSRSVTMFNSLDWLPFYIDSHINRCALVFKRTKGLLPSYLNDILKLNSDIHSRNTRFSKLNLMCPFHKKITEGGRSFIVRSIKDWNALDKSLKQALTIKSFKSKLFNKLLNKQKSELRFLNST